MAYKLPLNGNVLGLDIGDKRIGMARAHVIARLPQPIETIENNSDTATVISQIVHREEICLIVVGIPRNLDGQETAQSSKIRQLAEELAKQIPTDIVFVDESLSSVRADEYLAGFKKKGFSQDSVAACFILQEFFTIGAE